MGGRKKTYVVITIYVNIQERIHMKQDMLTLYEYVYQNDMNKKEH